MPTTLTAAATSVLLAFTGTGHHHHQYQHVPKGCAKHFTVPMAQRAINATYRGTRDVTAHEARHVHLYIHCQWSTLHRPMLNRYLDRAIQEWRTRVQDSYQTAYVSYYYDPPGSTNCCGVNYYYGVAVCGSGGGPCVPMGTPIEFEYDGRTVVARASDHGPYVAGRQFDLNQNVRAAIGFPGLGYVQYRILK